ncbi:TPA: ROK family transcriptional regulator [Pluralibacter gergoviae]|nr:ROK family transcriptional regulator [Pluralibacter gergoviae]
MLSSLNSTSQKILKLLCIAPQTQVQLAEKLNLSRSRVNQCIRLIRERGLICATCSNNQPLKLKAQKFYVLVIRLTLWESALYLYDCADIKNSVAIQQVERRQASAEQISAIECAISKLLQRQQLDIASVGALLMSTQGAVEQERGIILRSKLFPMTDFAAGEGLKKATGLPARIINVSYAEMLGLLRYTRERNLLAIMAGSGCVGVSIVIDGEIILGAGGLSPECVHLPYNGNLEGSLGEYTEHSVDALMFIIRSLAPLYNLKKIYLSGLTFEEHPELFKDVRSWLLGHDIAELRDVDIDFFPESGSVFRMNEVYLAAELAISHYTFSLPPADLGAFIRRAK